MSNLAVRAFDATKRELWSGVLVAMGIIDREYFEALAGRRFASDRAAARFYLNHERDASLGLSLSPLIERDWLNAVLTSTDASWYSALLTGPGLFSTSPYFDATLYSGAPHRNGARATLQAMRHFLRYATPTTIVPTHATRSGEPITWGDCRASALAGARLFAHQLHLRRARTTDNWDGLAARKFLESIAADDVPRDAAQVTVSVIMPTRDRVESLARAISSVQAQTHRDWQLIVVDDGSTDDTPHYLRKLALADERIVFIPQAATGVSAARNQGLARAKSEFVTFLDSDNTWRPEFLAYSLDGLRVRDADAVHCAVALHRDGGVVRYRGIEGTREDLLFAGNFLDLNSVMIRRDLVDAVDGFDESIRRWVDYDLFLAVSRTTVPIYLPFLGVDYDDHASEARISCSELPSWEDVVVGKHLIDWTALEIGAENRIPGTVSIIIPTFTDWRMTAAAVRSVLKHSGDRQLEVIVIDNGSRRHVYAILCALFGGETSVRIERMARNLNFALANNHGLSLSTGEFIITLNNDTEVTPGWLEPLISPLVASSSVLGTQPLLLYPDGTIQTAGTVFSEEGVLPGHFMVGHPAEDARRMVSTEFSAVTAAALCLRARDLIDLHGFDPLYTNGMEDVDLCLRARRLRDGSFRVVTDSVVYHHEGKSPGRSAASARNRALFLERWAGLMPSSDAWREVPVNGSSR